MKYINKIKSIVLRLYNNIKYILTSDLVELDMLDVVDDRVHYLEDKISTLLNDVDNIESTLDDKCDEYQVEDVIYNQVGSVDDLATYDDINDIKDDLKEVGELLEVLNNNNNDVNDIKEHLKTDWSKIDDINIDLFYDKYNLCLVNKVIEEIIIKLNNDNV